MIMTVYFVDSTLRKHWNTSFLNVNSVLNVGPVWAFLGLRDNIAYKELCLPKFSGTSPSSWRSSYLRPGVSGKSAITNISGGSCPQELHG